MSTRPTIPPSSPTPAPAPDGVPAGPLDYQLLDFGDGRRLERFGTRVVDRPAPAAPGPRRADAAAWVAADLCWEPDLAGSGRTGEGGHWVAGPAGGGPWLVEAGRWRLELRPTSSGQVGCYPEQAAIWRLLTERRPDAAGKVLNLFAHTGAATLAAAATGAAVTHVDGARGAVAWARQNAILSGLGAAPIRWLVDDAQAFAGREQRRGQRYDTVVLDTPAYGHGRGSRRWHLATDLPALLATCVALGGPGGPRCLILTAHATGLGPAEAAALVRTAWAGLGAQRLDAFPLRLTALDGRAMEAGVAVVARA